VSGLDVLAVSHGDRSGGFDSFGHPLNDGRKIKIKSHRFYTKIVRNSSSTPRGTAKGKAVRVQVAGYFLVGDIVFSPR
jgi:hypothetical protein